MLRTGRLRTPTRGGCRSTSTPASQPMPGAPLPRTLASPRTGLTPAGCPELVARVTSNLLLVRHLGLLDVRPGPPSGVRRRPGRPPPCWRTSRANSVDPDPSSGPNARTPDRVQFRRRRTQRLAVCHPRLGREAVLDDREIVGIDVRHEEVVGVAQVVALVVEVRRPAPVRWYAHGPSSSACTSVRIMFRSYVITSTPAGGAILSTVDRPSRRRIR